jgi:hypothetical protein
MPADTIIIIPTSMPRGWSWLERLEDELLLRGIAARIKERAEKEAKWYGRIDKDLIYDILVWRCMKDGESICPAVVFEDDKAYLLVLDSSAEKYVKIMDLEDVIIGELKGIVHYSDCVAKYGYDYC